MAVSTPLVKLIEQAGVEEQGGGVEPIASTVLLCPEPGAGSDLGVRVTAALVPGQPGQDAGAGTAGLETLPGKNQESSKITTPGGQAQIEAFNQTLPPTLVANACANTVLPTPGTSSISR